MLVLPKRALKSVRTRHHLPPHSHSYAYTAFVILLFLFLWPDDDRVISLVLLFYTPFYLRICKLASIQNAFLITARR